MPSSSFFKSKTKIELIEVLSAYERAIDINMICSITDLNGTIIYANQKFCDVSQYSISELIGNNHRILNSGHHPKTYFQTMWKTIHAGKTWSGEVKNKAKDGSFYWVDTVVLPILDKNGKITQYLSLRTLINERKRIEDQKSNMVNGLQEMLFMTSHKVRKSVTNCLGLLDMLENNHLDSKEEMWKVIKYMKFSAEELEAFTQELTDFMFKMKQEAKLDNKHIA